MCVVRIETLEFFKLPRGQRNILSNVHHLAKIGCNVPFYPCHCSGRQNIWCTLYYPLQDHSPTTSNHRYSQREHHEKPIHFHSCGVPCHHYSSLYSFVSKKCGNFECKSGKIEKIAIFIGFRNWKPDHARISSLHERMHQIDPRLDGVLDTRAL